MPLPVQTPRYLQISNRHRLARVMGCYSVNFSFFSSSLNSEILWPFFLCILMYLEPNRDDLKSDGISVFVRARPFKGGNVTKIFQVLVVEYAEKALCSSFTVSAPVIRTVCSVRTYRPPGLQLSYLGARNSRQTQSPQSPHGIAVG